ncbi:MAG: hypothetical protein AB7P22_03370 [Vicinamibacterales bacterium]
MTSSIAAGVEILALAGLSSAALGEHALLFLMSLNEVVDGGRDVLASLLAGLTSGHVPASTHLWIARPAST